MFSTQSSSLFLTSQNHAAISGKVECFEELIGSNQLIVGTSKGNLYFLYYLSNFDYNSEIAHAHADEITGISTHSSREKCWITSSSDHSCAVWDKSKALPASYFLPNHDSRLTDVKWINENLILLSDSSGHLLTMDLRKPKVIMTKQKVANRIINTLTFAKKNEKIFGVISESPVLKIFEIDVKGELSLVHEHCAETSIIYSMAWDEKSENECYVVGDRKYARKVKW